MEGEGKSKYALRLLKSWNSLEKATNRRKLMTAQRLWVQYDKRIHALNYFYYRYLTNRFELWMINNLGSKFEIN